MNRTRSTLRFTCLAFAACAALLSCSDDSVTPVDGGSATPVDARADVAPGTGADGSTGTDAANGDSGGDSAPLADGGLPTDADGGATSSDAGPLGGKLSAARVAAIRTCMDGRWGAAATRSAGDVADDFDACTTAAENTGFGASANFKQTIEGWAEPLPNDASHLRKVAPRDQ